MKNARLHSTVVSGAEAVGKIIPDLFDKAQEFTEGLDPETAGILEAMEPNQPAVDGLIESGKELAVEYSDEIREGLDNLLDNTSDEEDENGG